MRALTLWQPWASLIAEGYKGSETRSYAAPGALIGRRIAIHAAVRKASLEDVARFRHELSGKVMPYGAIVATVMLVRSVKIGYPAINNMAWAGHVVSTEGKSIQPLDPYGNYSNGRFVWKLTEMRRLPEPIPVKGAQGFWRVPEDIAKQIEEAA